ncbi:MAG: MFS transporter [Chloroflexota bacterium]
MNIWTRVSRYPKIGLVILAYVAFIALGMPDGLLGVAWPSIRASFSIPLDALGALLVAGTTGYLTSSFLSGTLLSRFGVGRVLIVSCALTGAALLGYTLVPEWWMMVLLGVMTGLGAGAIDAGLNTYVASHFGEGLMQWLHASYGIGVTLGPIIMTLALTRMNSWRAGYDVVSGVQFALAVGFILTLSMWSQADGHPAESEPQKRLMDYKTPMLETMRKPRVWRSVLLFLLYTGAEIALGVWTYSLLTEARGIAPEVAGWWAGSYWATFTIGRVLAGLFAKRIGVDALVQGGVLGAILGAALLWWNPFGAASLVGVALIGFAIAPIFPAMVSGTSQRVEEHDAANTIGMQMSAAGLGGAAIPSLVGVLARQVSLEVIPICLLVLFLALFGLYRLSIK